MGIRNHEAGHTGGGKLGHGHGAGAADHQIGLRVGGGHVIDEAKRLGGHAGLLVGTLQSLDMALAALMRDLRPILRRKHREGARHHIVERLGAQAAADHQQLQGAGAVSVATCRIGQCGQLATNRIAAPQAACQRIRESHQHAISQPGKHPVGQPGDRVLLMNGQRRAGERRHQSARKRDIAAHAQHHRRTHRPQRSQALPAGPGEVERQHQPGQPALAAQTAEAHPLHRDIVARHQGGLHAAGVAEPHHLPGAFAHDVGHRQPGKDMSAGAARHDQDRAAHVALPRIIRRDSKSIRKTSATATQLTRIPEPP
jgi:hypothetical protein